MTVDEVIDMEKKRNRRITVDEMIDMAKADIEDKKDFYSRFGHFSVQLDCGAVLSHLVAFRAALDVAMNELGCMRDLGILCETKKETDSGN